MRQPFSLQKRLTSKGKIVYYAQFWLEDQGKYSNAKSTGHRKKGAARIWAYQYLKNGSIIAKERITLNQFSENFFSANGEYYLTQASKGRKIGKRHLDTQTAHLKNHILPRLGQMQLSSIDTLTIENFRTRLMINGSAPATINHILLTLKIVLKWALRNRYIQNLPLFDMAKDDQKTKGIIAIDEFKKLFSLSTWEKKHYLINLLAYTTGMRLGECRGLQRQDIDFENKLIHIKHSWDRTYGIKSTKNNRERVVTIDSLICDDLSSFVSDSQYQQQDALVFHGECYNRPMAQKTIQKALYDKLKEIKIKEEVRIERNITFHSSRHFFNSFLLNNGVSEQKVRSLTGHLTKKMTEHYYHIDEMEDVRSIISGLTDGL